MIEVRKILKTFKNSDIKNIVERILEDVKNFTFKKGEVSDFSINVYQINPVSDEGSYCYYEREEDRDHDFEVLTRLVKTV